MVEECLGRRSAVDGAEGDWIEERGPDPCRPSGASSIRAIQSRPAPIAPLRYLRAVSPETENEAHHVELEALGYGPFFSAQLELIDGAEDLKPARVRAESRGVCELMGECRATLGELSGRLRHELGSEPGPTTGDWVAIEDGEDRAVIQHVLDRRTVLTRRAAGRQVRGQVVASNADLFFVVTSANRDLRPRRIERYLTAVWDSGAEPVIVLSKTDLVEDVSPLIESIEPVALAVPVVAVSAVGGAGMTEIEGFLAKGKTIGFVGSSGVGKSTLVNALLGRDAHGTLEIRADGKGRHATTRRELVVLPRGGVLIDTPGMREMGMFADEGGLELAFADITALAEHCRYRDCEHDSEPGCAVCAAAVAGELPADRLDSYRRLQRELAFTEARVDPRLGGGNSKRRWKTINKSTRALEKEERNRRR